MPICKNSEDLQLLFTRGGQILNIRSTFFFVKNYLFRVENNFLPLLETEAKIFLFREVNILVFVFETDRRQVSREDASMQCKEWGVLFEEISAKTDARITESFVALIR